MKLVALVVYWRYVPPLHVERSESENSHPSEGPSFRPFRVNEKFPFVDNRLEQRGKDIFVDSGKILHE
jgi:hypothetical protein